MKNHQFNNSGGTEVEYEKGVVEPEDKGVSDIQSSRELMKPHVEEFNEQESIESLKKQIKELESKKVELQKSITLGETKYNELENRHKELAASKKEAFEELQAAKAMKQHDELIGQHELVPKKKGSEIGILTKENEKLNSRCGEIQKEVEDSSGRYDALDNKVQKPRQEHGLELGCKSNEKNPLEASVKSLPLENKESHVIQEDPIEQRKQPEGEYRSHLGEIESGGKMSLLERGQSFISSRNAGRLVRKDRLKKSCEELSQELKRVKHMHDKAVQEKERAEARCKEAIKSRNNLINMLESQVVERKNTHSPHGSFPTGQQIEHLFLDKVEHAKESFCDLAFICVDEPTVETYKSIMERIFDPCAEYARFCAGHFVCTKMHQIAAFLDDDSNPLEHSNTLVNLLVLSNMQRCAVKWVGLSPNEKLGSAYKTADTIAWACSDEIISAWDGNHVELYMKGLFDLALFCRFSSPACHMWPPVGQMVEFSRAEHKQLKSGVLRKTAKDGNPVQVLYPGLYKADPENSEPVVKPLVVYLETGDQHNQKYLA